MKLLRCGADRMPGGADDKSLRGCLYRAHVFTFISWRGFYTVPRGNIDLAGLYDF